MKPSDTNDSITIAIIATHNSSECVCHTVCHSYMYV